MAVFSILDSNQPIDGVRATAAHPGHLPASSYPRLLTHPVPATGVFIAYSGVLNSRYKVGGSSTWERPGQ